MTAPVTDAAADAAAAAAAAAQKVAVPVAFIAIVIGGCLAVAVLVKRLGQSLPLPAYLADFVRDDEDQGDTADADDDDEEEPTREQWG